MSDALTTSLLTPRRRLIENVPHWTTILALIVLVLVIAMALLAPVLAHFEPTKLNPIMRLKPSSATYWLGTDSFGRDLYSRVIYGARVSLLVGAGVAFGSLVIGLPLGLIAGWFRSVDAVMMRMMDGLMAIPGILLAIAIVALTKAGLVTVIIAIMLPEIPQVVRLVRSRVIAARSETFVQAAVLLGTPTHKLILRHLLRRRSRRLSCRGPIFTHPRSSPRPPCHFSALVSVPRSRPGAISWRRAGSFSR